MKIRRLVSTVCCFILVLSLILLPSYANSLESLSTENSLMISSEEINTVFSNMLARNIDGSNFSVDLLFDCENKPSYFLGTTDNGYIILERGTFRFLESGECNPYQNFLSAKKYYGGLFYYYVEQNSNIDVNKDNNFLFYDILHNEETNTINTSVANITNKRESSNILSTKAVIGDPVIVDNAYNYIQRRAHGYNNDDTCSAVAVGIALNYMTLQTGKTFVPSAWRSELLSTRPTSASTASQLYPKAHSLHRYLVDTCDMGPASYADGVRYPFLTYVDNKVSLSYGLTIDWTLLPRLTTIKNNINNNIPVLITSTLAGDYSWHTMVVYGYRETNNGHELLVHTGWYVSPYTSSGSIVYQTQTWIPFDYATYAYYFSYN